jgi:hypothetical protein
MPMKLNLKERTEVEPAFYNALKELWKQRWSGLNNEILTADPRFKKEIIKRNGLAMGLLKAYCTNAEAFDHQKTQLVTLPYLKFWTVDHASGRYFAGLTKPILLSDGGSNRWQGPRFTVYIPMDYPIRGTGGKFHLVPEGHEKAYSRHPHHTGNYSNESPLDGNSSTCWGEFPTIVRGCVHSADTVNLFRVLHLYLTRVDLHSQLCNSWEREAGFVKINASEKARR